MKNILIYVDEAEPVTNVIFKNSRSLNISLLSLKELLLEGHIYDEFDVNETKIQWSIPSLGKITNSENIFLINRVFGIPETWFDDFSLQDQEYARNEFSAYMTFALNAFPKITEKPNNGSLNGGCYSLLEQWDAISKHFPTLITPEFYIGPVDFLPNELGSDLVFTHPYNFYFWKENQIIDEHRDNVFAIKKPKGHPLLSFYCNGEVSLHNLDNSSLRIDKNIEKLIIKFCKKINHVFNFFISESLFFLDGERITFGMIHNCPAGSSRTPGFEERVIKTIKPILLK